MNIYVVIVTYYPEIERLTRICSILEQNKANVILVDNSEECIITNLSSNENISIIPLFFNSGIAHAQNVGINEALTCGAEIIVFFDQDSEIEHNFLQTLISPIIVGKPMVVAPVSIDSKSGNEYTPFKFSKFGLLKEVYRREESNPYPVDVVISSGTAATKEVFGIAGLMDEDFFIDVVDSDWCIRCRAKGIPIFINPKSIMKHSIGIANVNLGIIKTLIHSPSRTYYKTRNPFLFLRKKNVPSLLGIKEILAALIHQFFQLFYVDNKKAYLKSYICAIYDGITGVKGYKKL
jgi:rhamnosyltransferase